MATTAAGATGSYEGGAGGKFQKRPLRNRTTKPYERPITAIRNPIEAGNRNGWISRIVDPAYGLITRSAQNFFKSLFTKSLTAPPPPVTETNHGQRVQFREAGPSVRSPESREHATGNEGDCLKNSLGDSKIDDLEKLLKEKTFTKDEIDRLTEVIHSRIGETAGNGKEASGLSTSQKATTQERQQLLHMAVQENGMVSQNLHGGVSASTFRSSEMEQDVASPTELAKAYMGNRSSKVSPSTLGLRSQSLREDVSLLTNAPFTPKSHSMSLVPRSAVRFPTVSENGFMTPRPRGRSTIYNMSRTPYSRVHNSGVLKIDAQVMTPSTSSQRPWENSTFSGGKQPSKRRISVLDSDIGSVGPIRRIRQKTNMLMSPSKAMVTPGSSSSNPLSADGSYAAQASTSPAQNMDESKQNNTSHLRPSENGYNSMPATSLSSVPSQSTQMAQKILQQLDKLVPSPKEKSSELRLASARGKSPAKLTLGMLQGQALRSVEDVDSSRFLVSAQSSGALDGAGGNSASGAEASTSPKQGKVKDNGPAGVFTFRDEKAPKANGVETKSSAEDIVPSGKASEMPPQKRAFHMSAHEDYLDMDDDSYSDRVNLTPAVAETDKLSTSMVQSPSNAAETVSVAKPITSFSEALTVNAISSGADFGASDGAVIVSKKDSSSALPVTPSPSAAVVESAPASQLVSPVENSEPKGQTAFAFNFATKAYNQGSLVESTGVVFGAPSIKKIEAISSTAAGAVSVTEHVPKDAELGKSNGSTRKADESSKQSENVISSPVPSSTPLFSFGAPTNSSSNLSSASTTSLFCPPTTVAPNASKGLDTSIDTTGTTTVVAANGITNPSNAASTNSSISTLPATPAAPFQFGLSSTPAVVPSSSSTLPLPSSGSEDKHLEGITKQPPPSGSLTSTGDAPSITTSTGNGIFSFNASNAVNPFANNKPQTHPFVSATGSKAATAESGSGTAPSTNSTPSPFGSSAPSPTFGFTGASTVSSVSPLFGNSSPAVNPFGSSTGFGQSSSTSFSMTAGSFSSGTAANSSFSPSFQSTPSTVFGGFATGTSTVGFAFGASKSDAGSTPSTSTGFSFGSLPAPVSSSAPLPGSSPFSFTSAASGTAALNSLSPNVSSFGTSPVIFGTSPNNDQMNMEDSMAEDVLQASAPVVPAFGQPTSSTSPFLFNSLPPSGGSPFTFGGQQNPVTPQMANPFQAPPGEFGLGGAGSFSLGSAGGGDKSGRKIIKVRRDKLRKR
ncbi:nuclear pore complex protein NUP1-like isoform X1 [Papaver somniferum]|uniref:nuclear pore complex protein NUP1-like isoform X1 n=1 Tax=Papaver somniferum TaxID=3469 RepID=UPI000E6FF126|nr:nuclear pore complex protein NUP1-like isoform X1 [Papaver somniferum]